MPHTLHDQPIITVTSPTQGATYTKDEVVPVIWSYDIPVGKAVEYEREGADHRRKHQQAKGGVAFLDTSRVGRNKAIHFVVKLVDGPSMTHTILYNVVE